MQSARLLPSEWVSAHLADGSSDNSVRGFVVGFFLAPGYQVTPLTFPEATMYLVVPRILTHPLTRFSIDSRARASKQPLTTTRRGHAHVLCCHNSDARVLVLFTSSLAGNYLHY